MKKYGEYFSEGIGNKNAVWSGIYEDRLGYGRVISVTKPIYLNFYLFGVVGLDIPISYLQKHYKLEID